MNGTKTWVSQGPEADLFTVFAGYTQISDVNEYSMSKNVINWRFMQFIEFVFLGLTAILVDRNMPGVTVGPPKKDTIGMKGLSISDVTFDRVTIPAKNVLGNK